MKKYIRSERANLFEPNVYIGMVVKLSGSPETEDIRRAVEEAYRANEATMSKIVLAPNGDAWYEKMERTGCAFAPTPLPWQEILRQSQQQPFALAQGELVRIFLSEEDGQKVLTIHAHHLVGDGKSILVLLQDIVSSLAHQRLRYKPLLSVDREFLQKRARLYFGTAAYIQGVNRKWKKAGTAFTWENYASVHQRYWSRNVSDITYETFDLDTVKAQCPQGVTLNSFLIAKLLRDHPDCKVVGIPVSIREDDGMSNQVSGIAVKYGYDSNCSFEANARQLHKAIGRKLGSKRMKYFILSFMERLCPSLIDGVLLQTHGCCHNPLAEKMAQVMGYLGDGGRDLGVTNLGQIDIPGGRIQDILFIPPKVSYTKKVVGISSFNGKLTVCHHNMCQR